MPDFISQDYFSEDMLPTSDGIAHDAFANSVTSYLPTLPMGCAVAIQGSWGRGKTDVLARIAGRTYQKAPPLGLARKAIWINPWRYATTDLFSPLVLQLLSRLPQKSITPSSGARLREAAQTIILGGISFGMKAVATFVPGAGILGMVEEHTTKALEGLLSVAEKERESQAESLPQQDPVDAMSARFRELVDEILKAEGAAPHDRLLICVDDLDRCLPDRQIAFLEAIRFLIAANARATFLIALDPTLTRSALMAHYRSEDFDPDRYLEKMFEIRLTLPAISPTDLGRLFVCLTRQSVILGTDEITKHDLLAQFLGAENIGKVPDLLRKWLSVPDIRNPRILTRIITRLELLARSQQGKKSITIGNDNQLGLLIGWLAIAERWPQIRITTQDAGDQFVRRFRSIRDSYMSSDPHSLQLHKQKAWEEGSGGAMGSLPKPDAAPQLVQHLRLLGNDMADDLYAIDKMLVCAGL